MVAEDTQRAAADRDALCQWELTADGDLIARWYRGCRVIPDITLYRPGEHCAHSGMEQWPPRVGGIRVSQRLAAAVVVLTMYFATGFGLFAVFVAR
jgi:hypothetical protein